MMNLVGSLLGPLITTLVLVITTLFLLYKYLTRNNDFWKIRNVPYAPSYHFFGTRMEGGTNSVHESIMERYKKYGNLHGYFEGPKPMLSIGDPELLRDIFSKDFQYFTGHRPLESNDEIIDQSLGFINGERWKRVRTLISPIFSTGKIKRVFSMFLDGSVTLVNSFRSAAEKNEPVNVKHFFGAFTMDIIASASCSMKIDSHNDPDNEFSRRGRNIFDPSRRWSFILTVLFPRLMKLFGVTLMPKEDVDFFKKVIYQVIEHRKRTGEVQNDFLQLLLDSTKETADEGKADLQSKDGDDLLSNYGENNVSFQKLKNFSNQHLSMDEMVAQSVGFFTAGYETVAATLSFASYLLALNQDVQEKLCQEVDEALENSDGKFTYENVQNMKYLDNIISETLRLYPPAIAIERMAETDYKLANTEITVPKGMIIHIPIYAIQRDPKNYPEPEKFDPDRFSAEEKKKRSPYAFLPFSAGPRNCVGMRFALIEMKVCLAHIIANFTIQQCVETKVPIEFHPGMGFLQPKDIILEMKIREK